MTEVCVEITCYDTHRLSRSSRSASLSVHTDLTLRKSGEALTSWTQIPKQIILKSPEIMALYVLCTPDLPIPLFLLSHLDDPDKTWNIWVNCKWFDFCNITAPRIEEGRKVSQVWLTMSPGGPGGPSTFPSSPCSPCQWKSEQWC